MDTAMQTNFDYNTLKVLSVILETRNVTAAAEKLCTSQPAVSRSLKGFVNYLTMTFWLERGCNGANPKGRRDKNSALEHH